MTGAVWRLAAAAGARAGAEPQRRSLRRGFHVYAAGCRRMGRHDGLPRNRQAACQAPRSRVVTSPAPHAPRPRKPLGPASTARLLVQSVSARCAAASTAAPTPALQCGVAQARRHDRLLARRRRRRALLARRGGGRHCRGSAASGGAALSPRRDF